VWDKLGGVKGACIVQKCSKSEMHARYLLLLCQWCDGVSITCILYPLSIGGWRPTMWFKLWPCWCYMLVLVHRCLDVSRHGEVDSFVDVVLPKCDTIVEAVKPTNRDLIRSLKDSGDILGILMAHIADAKIIQHKGKKDGARGVLPEAWSECCMMVPMEGQVSCDNACRGFVIHSFLHFHENSRQVKEGCSPQ
jgi:hypothetical protein